MKLSPDQRSVVNALKGWWTNGSLDIKLGGLAGTGKTTLAVALPELLGVSAESVAYAAYTGKAANVLQQKGAKAQTLHRLIYTPQEEHCTDCPREGAEYFWEDGRWMPNAPAQKRCHSSKCADCYVIWTKAPELAARLVVVDEASMVNEDIYEDLLSYGVRIVWVGDHGQLPPVKSEFKLMDQPDLRLERIHRQAAGSPILKLAYEVRHNGRVAIGSYGPGVSKRAWDGSLEVEQPWPEDLLVLCGTNRTRVTMNRIIREQTFGYPPRPIAGDRVICLRNNQDAGIFNGMLGTVVRCEGEEDYDLSVTLDDRPGMMYRGTAPAEQFYNKNTLTELPRHSYDLWDFAYCLTVHKAQGSEARRVVLFEERFGDRDFQRRWMYTGITRAKEELEIIAMRSRRGPR